MSNSTNDVQAELVAKVELLFRYGTDESKLVGLLLATRIQNDGSFVELVSATITSDWIMWLIHQLGDKAVRLLSQILHRSVVVDETVRQHSVWLDSVGSLLAQHYNETSSPDCMLAVQVWLEYCRKSKTVDEAMFHLQTTLLQERNDEAEEYTTDEAKDSIVLLRSTVDGLLEQTAIDSTTVPPPVERVLVRGATRVLRAQHVPRFWKPLITAWLDKKTLSTTTTTTTKRATAAHVILRTAQLFSKSHFTTANIDGKMIVQVVLACVVSNDEALRPLGWTTLVRMVQSLGGWDWMMTVAAPQQAEEPLGRAKAVCTLVRLAAGECKIQLTELLGEQHQQQQQPDTSSSTTTQPRTLLLLEACSHFLVETVNFLSELEEKDYSFSGDAILHLQRSLEECRSVTAEYLLLCSDPSIFALRLMGSFLTEMDAFDGLKEDHGSVLHGLRVALQHAKDDTTHGHVLRGTLAVLLSAQDDESRQEVLRNEKITGDVLSKYICRTLSSLEDPSLIGLACQVAECHFTVEPVFEITLLQQTIICCLERLLRRKSADAALSSTVSQLIGMYVLLQGEEPPNDEKSTSILQQSFEYCQRYSTY